MCRKIGSYSLYELTIRRKKIESETINVRRKIYNGQNDTTTNSEWNIKEVVYKFVHQ